MGPPGQTRAEKSEIRVQYRPEPDRVVNLGYRFQRRPAGAVRISRSPGADHQHLARLWTAGVFACATMSRLSNLRDSNTAAAAGGVRRPWRGNTVNRTGERDNSCTYNWNSRVFRGRIRSDTFLDSGIRGYSPRPADPFHCLHPGATSSRTDRFAAARRPAAGRPPIAQTREHSRVKSALDRVVAVVNDGMVTESELDEQTLSIRDRLAAQKTQLPPDDVLRKQVLDRLIIQEIQFQRAKRIGLTDHRTSSSTPRCSDIAQRNNLTLDAAAHSDRRAGTRLRHLSRNMRREITMQHAAAARRDRTSTSRRANSTSTSSAAEDARRPDASTTSRTS